MVSTLFLTQFDPPLKNTGYTPVNHFNVRTCASVDRSVAPAIPAPRQ